MPVSFKVFLGVVSKKRLLKIKCTCAFMFVCTRVLVHVFMEAGGRKQTKPLCFCVKAGASQAGTNLTEPQINGLSG